MFQWLWERLGGGKGAKAPTEEQPSVDTEKIEEPAEGSAETDLSDDTKAEASDDVDMEETASPVVPKETAAATDDAATATKARPKKANATTAKSKPYRNSASAGAAAQEMPAKKKSNRGTTMLSTGTPSKAVAARRRGKLDFEQFFPKLVAFAEEQGHWNIPADTKLYSFVQSLCQHMRRIEEWEEETKIKYSEIDRDMANELMFTLTPSEVLRLEKSGFSWKEEKSSGRAARRKASGV